MNQNLINEARESAFRGLDFFVRTQSNFPGSADCGRFTNIANVKTGDPRYFTSNWLTGILASTMLDAWKMTGKEEYLKSANDAIRYIYSLQELAPWRTRTYGAIHEVTRDGLSAAIALLDHAVLTGNDESMQRAILFGEWFIKYIKIRIANSKRTRYRDTPLHTHGQLVWIFMKIFTQLKSAEKLWSREYAKGWELV